MGTNYIVVADAGRARIFLNVEGTDHFIVLHDLDNPHGRAHNTELVTDRPGRFERLGSYARSGKEARTEPHEEKATEFARQLNQILAAAAERDEYQMLELIAPPHFLGLLRLGLSPAASSRLVLCKANDFTRLDLPELESRVSEAVRYSRTELVRLSSVNEFDQIAVTIVNQLETSHENISCI